MPIHHKRRPFYFLAKPVKNGFCFGQYFPIFKISVTFFLCVIYAMCKKVVKKRVHTNVCFTINNPLKMLLSYLFSSIIFPSINLTFVKNLKKKTIFLRQIFKVLPKLYLLVCCLITFCDLATLDSKMTAL